MGRKFDTTGADVVDIFCGEAGLHEGGGPGGRETAKAFVDMDIVLKIPRQRYVLVRSILNGLVCLFRV
jgi:hypothetical protein